MGLVSVVQNVFAVGRVLWGKDPTFSLPGSYRANDFWDTPDTSAPDERDETPDGAEVSEAPDIVEDNIFPQLLVTQEWGLLFPTGKIAWGSWQGVSFGNPVDRIHMVAKLQKTAEELGFEQRYFLAHYRWVTRTERAHVTYEDTGAHDLTAPEAFADDVPSGEQHDDDDDPENGAHEPTTRPDRDFCSGSVGGDA